MFSFKIVIYKEHLKDIVYSFSKKKKKRYSLLAKKFTKVTWLVGFTSTIK